MRQSVAEGCEQQIWRFFEGGGQVVIYDANNGTRAARQRLAEIFDKAGIHVVFLGKLSSPDDDCLLHAFFKSPFVTTKKLSRRIYGA